MRGALRLLNQIGEDIEVLSLWDLSEYSRIPPSSAGGMNGLPSPLAAGPEGLWPGGEERVRVRGK